MENLIDLFVLPSNLMTWLFILTVVLYLVKRAQLSRLCVAGAIAIYFIFGCGPISQLLLSKLEYQYPQYKISDSAEPEPSTIVLLTGSADPKLYTPVSSHPNISSAYRLLEARRIYKLLPQAKIIITGLDDTPETLKNALISLDVPAPSISVETESHNTYASAQNLSAILDKQPFILVTSAGHMPRAMAVFKAHGLNPVPAPTEFKSRENILAAQYLPTPRHMVYSDLAVHEYLGMIWYRLTGRI